MKAGYLQAYQSFLDYSEQIGSTNISKVSLIIRPINDCPEIIVNPSKILLNECVEESEVFDMSVFFKDAENTPLVYGAKSSNSSLVKV